MLGISGEQPSGPKLTEGTGEGYGVPVTIRSVTTVETFSAGVLPLPASGVIGATFHAGPMSASLGRRSCRPAA
jgi:hypothetical protein